MGGGGHITAEFLLKVRSFHLHKLLLGIRRIAKRASARASASEVLKASAIFCAHSGNNFSGLLASRFPTLFPYLINFDRARIFLTAHLS